MEHFFVEIVYRAPIEKIEQFVNDHRKYLNKLYDKGIILMSGPQVPRLGGVIIARAESMEELNSYLKEDPYQKNKLADYRFIQFNPRNNQSFLVDWVAGK